MTHHSNTRLFRIPINLRLKKKKKKTKQQLHAPNVIARLMKFAKNTDQTVWKHLHQIVENESEKIDKELGFLGPKNENSFGSKGQRQLSYQKVSR